MGGAEANTFLLTLVGVMLLAVVMSWLPRSSFAARSAAALAVIALSIRYIWWRATETIPTEDTIVDLVVGVLFLGIEGAALLTAAASQVFLMRVLQRTPEVDRILAAEGPRPEALVDVFICTYNEEKDVLEPTIINALALAHPATRVWVLDDGRRAWLSDLCRVLGSGYITRPDNAHAKAGNVNHALAHVNGLPERPEFVMILDADFSPRPQFITRTLALMSDPSVGIVQTPQIFANPDPIQHNLALGRAWPDEQRYFFDIVQPSKDAWGAAFCCGTSSLIRVSALEAIGGFPTESVTEDYLLSVKLRAEGWRTVYLNEPLSFGLAPEGLREYITQRSRWCLGLMQIIRGPLSPFRPTSRITLADRIGLIDAFGYWSFSYLFRIVCLFAPILYFALGIKVMNADVGTALSYMAPYVLTSIIVMWWLSEGRSAPVMNEVSQLIAAPEIVKAVLTGLARPKGHAFKVTAKGGDRGKLVVQWPLMTRVLAMLSLTLLAILYAFALQGGDRLDEAGALCLFWAWYNVGILAVAFFVAIEQPRWRKTERIPYRAPISIRTAEGDACVMTSIDISAGGMMIAGAAPAPKGAPVTVAFHGLSGSATIVRVGTDNFALGFQDDFRMRAAVLQKLSREGATALALRTDAVNLLRGLGARLMR
jgi:cellulose synthase (UDP-forming)